jgi:stage III sporulation protein AF
MSFLSSWITNIILFVLLAIVLELLLPNSALQKYVKMVIGLLLIVIILTPVLKFITEDFDKVLASVGVSTIAQEKKIENLIESKKREIQASQHAYILEQMAVHMKTAIEEELMANYGVTISKIDIEAKQDEQGQIQEVTEIYVTLSDQPVSEPQAVEVVKRVEIDTSKQRKRQSEANNEQHQEMQSFLSYRWGIKKEVIFITLEGGQK